MIFFFSPRSSSAASSWAGLLTAALPFDHLGQESALKTHLPDLSRGKARASAPRHSFSSPDRFISDWWKRSCLLPDEDGSYRSAWPVLMASLYTFMSVSASASLNFWVHFCINDVRRSRVRACLFMRILGPLLTCIFYTSRAAFVYFPGCPAQAAVVEWAMLGSRPIETMPDGLISVCGCEKDACVFCNYRACKEPHCCVCVIFTSVFEF